MSDARCAATIEIEGQSVQCDLDGPHGEAHQAERTHPPVWFQITWDTLT